METLAENRWETEVGVLEKVIMIEIEILSSLIVRIFTFHP